MGKEGVAGLQLDSMFGSRPMIEEYGVLVLLRPSTMRFMQKTIEVGYLSVICLPNLFGAIISISE